eukprot:gene2394-3191_t
MRPMQQSGGEDREPYDRDLGGLVLSSELEGPGAPPGPGRPQLRCRYVVPAPNPRPGKVSRAAGVNALPGSVPCDATVRRECGGPVPMELDGRGFFKACPERCRDSKSRPEFLRNDYKKLLERLATEKKGLEQSAAASGHRQAISDLENELEASKAAVAALEHQACPELPRLEAMAEAAESARSARVTEAWQTHVRQCRDMAQQGWVPPALTAIEGMQLVQGPGPGEMAWGCGGAGTTLDGYPAAGVWTWDLWDRACGPGGATFATAPGGGSHARIARDLCPGHLSAFGSAYERVGPPRNQAHRQGLHFVCRIPGACVANPAGSPSDGAAHAEVGNAVQGLGHSSSTSSVWDSLLQGCLHAVSRIDGVRGSKCKLTAGRCLGSCPGRCIIMCASAPPAQSMHAGGCHVDLAIEMHVRFYNASVDEKEQRKAWNRAWQHVRSSLDCLSYPSDMIDAICCTLCPPGPDGQDDFPDSGPAGSLLLLPYQCHLPMEWAPGQQCGPCMPLLPTRHLDCHGDNLPGDSPLPDPGFLLARTGAVASSSEAKVAVPLADTKGEVGLQKAAGKKKKKKKKTTAAAEPAAKAVCQPVARPSPSSASNDPLMLGLSKDDKERLQHPLSDTSLAPADQHLAYLRGVFKVLTPTSDTGTGAQLRIPTDLWPLFNDLTEQSSKLRIQQCRRLL